MYNVKQEVMNTTFYSLSCVRLVFASDANPLSTRRKNSRNAQRYFNIVLFLKVCSYTHNLRPSINHSLSGSEKAANLFQLFERPNVWWSGSFSGWNWGGFTQYQFFVRFCTFFLLHQKSMFNFRPHFYMSNVHICTNQAVTFWTAIFSLKGYSSCILLLF